MGLGLLRSCVSQYFILTTQGVSLKYLSYVVYFEKQVCKIKIKIKIKIKPIFYAKMYMSFWSTTIATSKSKPKWAFRYLNKNGLVAHLGGHKPIECPRH